MGRHMALRLYVTAALLAAVGASLLLLSSARFATQVLGVVMLCGCCLCVDIAQLMPAESHSLPSLLLQYVAHRWIPLLLGLITTRYMKNTFTDCQKHQKAALAWILEQNRDTALVQEHELTLIRSREELIGQQPLTTYRDYEDYVQRIVRGQKGVMSKAQVIYLALSSGTTGKNKMYPFTLGNALSAGAAFAYHKFRMRALYKDVGLKRNFLFRIFHPRRKSECGIPIGALSQWYGIPSFESNIMPADYIYIEKEMPVFYVQAVFAIAEPELGCFDGFSSDLMYAFFNFIVLNKEDICESIAKGRIERYQDLDEVIRQRLNARLRPDPGRARQVREALGGGKVGLALRLWPGLALCKVATAGSFANSKRLLAATYMRDVPMAFTIHSATEGLLGIALDPAHPDEYTMPTNYQFLEFIPEDRSNEGQPQTLYMEQLEVGKRYEMVLTTISGLYRNRLGDVIQVTGFQDNTPKYRLCYRSGQILNVALERTPETALYEALRSAFDLWPAITLHNYTSTESYHLEPITGDVVSPGCYFILVEVTSDEQDDVRLTSEHQSQVERCLYEGQESYGSCRDRGGVGHVRLVQVCAGSFDAVRMALYDGCPNVQFKMPRVQRRPAILQLLWGHRLTPSP